MTNSFDGRNLTQAEEKLRRGDHFAGLKRARDVLAAADKAFREISYATAAFIYRCTRELAEDEDARYKYWRRLRRNLPPPEGLDLFRSCVELVYWAESNPEKKIAHKHARALFYMFEQRVPPDNARTYLREHGFEKLAREFAARRKEKRRGSGEYDGKRASKEPQGVPEKAETEGRLQGPRVLVRPKGRAAEDCNRLLRQADTAVLFATVQRNADGKLIARDITFIKA